MVGINDSCLLVPANLRSFAFAKSQDWRAIRWHCVKHFTALGRGAVRTASVHVDRGGACGHDIHL
jgi:hypothetical protein